MIAAASPSPRSQPAAAPAASGRRTGDQASPTAFLDALAPAEEQDTEPASERQDDADDCKTVPAENPFAWLATLAPPVPAPEPQPVPVQAGNAPEVAALVQAQPDALGAAPLPQPPAAPRDLLALAKDPSLANVHGPVEIELGKQAVVTAPVPAVLQSPTPDSLPAVPPGTTAPAGQVFAAALHAATRDEKGDKPTMLDPAALPAIHTGADLAAHAVTAAGDAATGGALDMRDEQWPHAMLDRIERLRDEANINDTRIRLVPDRLGSIDVALRRDGDTLHVRFHAAQPETRAMLADARPQLAQIAEQRGMRLGDSQVGNGAGQQGQSQQADSRPRQAPRPASPIRSVGPAAADLSTDSRIA